MEFKTLLDNVKKNKIDPCDIEICFNYTKNIGGYIGELEPYEQIAYYTMDIIQTKFDENGEERKKIGYCKCYLIEPINSLTNQAIDILESADSEKKDILNAVEPFVDNYGTIKDNYIDDLILYIDKLFIIPEYRHKGIGSLCLYFIINDLPASFVIAIPFPTELQKKSELKDLKEHKDFDSEMDRVCRFYKNFGFKPVNEEVWRYNIYPDDMYDDEDYD